MADKKIIKVISCMLVFILLGSPALGGEPFRGNILVDATTSLNMKELGLTLETQPEFCKANSVDVRAELVDISSLEVPEGTYLTRVLDLTLVRTDGRELSTIIKDYRVCFDFDELDFRRASGLKTYLPVERFRIAYWDQYGKSWQELPSTVFWDGTRGRVEAETSYIGGRFALLWNSSGSARLSQAPDGIRLTFNNALVSTDVPPYINNGRTMVPLRVVAENLGTEVKWDNSDKRVEIESGTDTIKLWVGVNEAQMSSGAKYLDTPPEIVGGRCFVPLRFVTETLGAKVAWDGVTRTVKISTK